MAFEFISKNLDGNQNKGDKKIPLILGILTAILLVIYIFRIELSLNIGYELRNSYPEVAYELINFSASEGDTAAQIFIIENASSQSSIKKVDVIYKKWLSVLSKDNVPEALMIVGEHHVSGNFGFSKDPYLGADFMLKALTLNPNLKNAPEKYFEISKIFATDFSKPTGYLNSTDVTLLSKARFSAKIAFENNIKGSSLVYAKTYINKPLDNLSKEQSLLEAIKILSSSVAAGENNNGLLANTYIDLYNLTKNRSNIISALKYYKAASFDKTDPFYSVASSQIEVLSQELSNTN